jgi:adenylate kinase
MKLVLLGAPGAGKGTQASNLAEMLQIPHISTGDIFRANMRENTPLGVKAKSFIDQGMLVPDELTVDLVMDRLAQADCVNGYILDGFPRTLGQADALAAQVELDAVVNIDVPDEVIVGRMGGRRVCPACGESYHVEFNPPKQEGICNKCSQALIIRKDDVPETVQKRLTVYHEQTAPLIEYYEKQGKLITVDGTVAPNEVTAAIAKAIQE